MYVGWMIIWFATYLVGAVWYELYIAHMFQQNSYKPREYREWMQVHSNIGRLLGKCLYAVISLPLIWTGNTVCLAAAFLMNLMTIWVNKPRKAKKPLVYTPRVKRMLMTTAIIYLLGIVVSVAAGVSLAVAAEWILRVVGAVLIDTVYDFISESDEQTG